MTFIEVAPWGTYVEVKDKLDELSEQASNTRVWDPLFNWRGIVGEGVFAATWDLPFDPLEKLAYLIAHGLSDGGEDFPGVDVKSTRYDPPFLKVEPKSLKRPIPFYACVYVDLDRRGGSYFGYASRDEMRAAPTGYAHPDNPHPPHVLKPGALTVGVPPTCIEREPDPEDTRPLVVLPREDLTLRIRTDEMPTPRRDGEGVEDWHARCWRDWPSCMGQQRLFAMLDENAAARA